MGGGEWKYLCRWIRKTMQICHYSSGGVHRFTEAVYTDLCEVEYTNTAKWRTKIQRSRVHNSNEVEYTNLAVEQLWLVQNNKFKSRNSELLGYNQMASF